MQLLDEGGLDSIRAKAAQLRCACLYSIVHVNVTILLA